MTTRTAPRPQQGQEHGLMFFLVTFLIMFIFWIYQPPIMYGCCWLLYQLWSLCDFPRTHTYVAERINLLAFTSNRVNDLTLSEFIGVMNKTAGILMAPLLVIVFGSMIAVRNHPRNRTRRHIDVYTLPHIMSQFSPTIIPALCYGDKQTQLLNTDPEEHRSAKSPDEFALQHQLIIGDRLDRDKAKFAFEQQLGPQLVDASSFNHHERAIFAVFGLQAFLKDRKAAEKLLDDLNRSCLVKSRRDKGQKGYPVLRLANSAFERVVTSPGVEEWLRRYSTTRTALSALHDQDLRLPGARFRWLKGLDRTLWYVLSSTGRPKVFIEGAGVIAAAKWETLIAEVSKRLRITIPIPENRMDKAIDGLEIDLKNMGLVLEERNPQATAEALIQSDDEDEEQQSIVILKNHTASAPTSGNYVPTSSDKKEPIRPKSPGRAHFVPRAR